jgi:hypothetical protein
MTTTAMSRTSLRVRSVLPAASTIVGLFLVYFVMILILIIIEVWRVSALCAKQPSEPGEGLISNTLATH